MRGPIRYFGPYAMASAIQEMLNLLSGCSTRECPAFATEIRPIPCRFVARRGPSAGSPQSWTTSATSWQGQSDDPQAALEEGESAADLDFERAFRLRDDLGAVRRAWTRRWSSRTAPTMPTSSYRRGRPVASIVFHVHSGGARGWIINVDSRSAEGLGSLRGELPAVPQPRGQRQCHRAQGDPRTGAAQPGGGHRGGTHRVARRCSKFSVGRLPHRGDKRALAETVTGNAARGTGRLKARPRSDGQVRGARRTRCHGHPAAAHRVHRHLVQGTDVVASLVVFEDGLPKRSDYRRTRCRDPRAVPHPSPRCPPAVRPRRAARTKNSVDAPASRRSARRTPRDPRAPARRTSARSQVRGGVAPSRRHQPPRPAAQALRLPAATAGGRRRRAPGERSRGSLAELGIVDVRASALLGLEEVWVPDRQEPSYLPAHQ